MVREIGLEVIVSGGLERADIDARLNPRRNGGVRIAGAGRNAGNLSSARVGDGGDRLCSLATVVDRSKGAGYRRGGAGVSGVEEEARVSGRAAGLVPCRLELELAVVACASGGGTAANVRGAGGVSARTAACTARQRVVHGPTAAHHRGRRERVREAEVRLNIFVVRMNGRGAVADVGQVRGRGGGVGESTIHQHAFDTNDGVGD